VHNITASITIDIPYVSKHLSIDSQTIIRNKKGKMTIAYTPGMLSMMAGIATRVTGASNGSNAKWDPNKPIHLKLIGWKPRVNCDLHNTLKLIVDAVVVGLEKWGVKDDRGFVIDGIQPYYNKESKMHGNIYIRVQQLDEEAPEPDCMEAL